MRYKILQSKSKKEITDKINEHLNDGWELSGELKAILLFKDTRLGNDYEYFQSMIHKTKVKRAQEEILSDIENLAILPKDVPFNADDLKNLKYHFVNLKNFDKSGIVVSKFNQTTLITLDESDNAVELKWIEKVYWAKGFSIFNIRPSWILIKSEDFSKLKDLVKELDEE